MDKRPEHILIVDDEQSICDVLQEYLTTEGFRVSVATDGAGLREAIERDPADLVILDLMLGGEDGLQLARELRDKSEIGIIMLTGRGDTVDRIIGLEMGADDYLTKPCHLRELLARVRSVSRRTASRRAKRTAAGARSVVQFAGWSLDLATRALTSPRGDEVRLTAGEFELLDTFVNHPNRVLSRDQLLDLSRRRVAGPFDRTIDVQVGRLRRKLGDDPKDPMLIKTVRGGGYMFNPVGINEREISDQSVSAQPVGISAMIGGAA